MSNGPLITGECKQEETLQTDRGINPGVSVCCGLENRGFMCVFYVRLCECVPSLEAALLMLCENSFCWELQPGIKVTLSTCHRCSRRPP